MAGKPRQRTADWQSRVKGVLKAELKRRGLTYADLAERLNALGGSENERNLSNKIGRGTFTAAFFLRCLDAIDCKTIHLGDE